MSRVHIHLGVHKTATTYLQTVLNNNKEKLQDYNVRYFSLDEVRWPLKELKKKTVKDAPKLSQKIKDAFEEKQLVVISEENIIGTLDEHSSSRRFYPNVKPYLKKLTKNLRSLGAEEIKFFICLRAYDKFMTSAYCEYIKHYPFQNFNQYISLEDIEEYNWHFLTEDIAEIVGQGASIFWEFEQFFKNKEKIISKLLNQDIGGLLNWNTDDGQNVRRASFSQKTIDIMELINRNENLTTKESGMLSYYVDRVFPKSERNEVFSPFSKKQIYSLRFRYERDIRKLKEKYSFIL